MLSNHESIYIEYKLNGEVYGVDYYNKDCTYEAAYGWMIFVTDNGYYYSEDNESKRILLLSPEGLTDIASHRAEYYDFVMGTGTLDVAVFVSENCCS